jgi:enoyl-CoA hydratase/carnithine racemase
MTDDFEFLKIDHENDTVTIRMCQPERRNVLTAHNIRELQRALSQAGDSKATGVIIAGEGPVYCAGHDFSELAHQDAEHARQLFELCTSMMNTMQQIPQPVIARVHALATGAGCQLVAAADLAVASEDASFCAPGGRGGLFCTTPMVAIGRSIGRKRALEMSMSGDPIDAHTAQLWGLVNEVVPAAQLESATAELMARVTRGSAESKGIGKLAFYKQMDMPQTEAYDYAIDVMATASQSRDSQEAIAAFLEKRTPKWN